MISQKRYKKAEPPHNKKIEDEEYLYRQIIMEGILSIQSGENPKSLRENLYALVEEGKKNAQSAARAEAQEQQQTASRKAA